jgi:hypothetical protein
MIFSMKLHALSLMLGTAVNTCILVQHLVYKHYSWTASKCRYTHRYLQTSTSTIIHNITTTYCSGGFTALSASSKLLLQTINQTSCTYLQGTCMACFQAAVDLLDRCVHDECVNIQFQCDFFFLSRGSSQQCAERCM